MSATPRDIRRLAFQTLFQLDARGANAADEVRMTLAGAGDFSPKEQEKAFTLAQKAYAERAAADAEFTALAPTWPTYRQAGVDRAILRLAHYEMSHTTTHPRIVVNEAIELAKEFSGEKGPAFVNGLLDKVLKRLLAARGEGTEGTPTPSTTEPIPEPRTP